MTAPSGEQIEIAHADQRAVVVEVGGGLRAYSAGGRDILDGYGADEMCTSGRGQVLIPWPNRVLDGSYEFEGRRHQLPIDDVEEQAAIHGLVRWAAWTIGEREPNRIWRLPSSTCFPPRACGRRQRPPTSEGAHVRTEAVRIRI